MVAGKGPPPNETLPDCRGGGAGSLLILSDMAGVEALRIAKAVLAKNGATGPIRWLHDNDDWVFIVSTRGAANLREAEAIRALTDLLGAKVWVATDGDAWAGRGAAL